MFAALSLEILSNFQYMNILICVYNKIQYWQFVLINKFNRVQVLCPAACNVYQESSVYKRVPMSVKIKA